MSPQTISEPMRRSIACDTSGGRLDTSREASEVKAPSREARTVMGILAGVGHDRFSRLRNERLGDHTPAGICHELNPKALKLRQNPGFPYLVMRGTPAGHDDRYILMLRAAAAEGG